LGFLRSVRREAIRKRTWFNAIDVLERGIVNLTIDQVEKVESLTLSRVLLKICKKIKEASKSIFIRYYESYGLEKAATIVEQAVKLGNDNASNWLLNSSFSMLITLNYMYGPIGWR
jgi:hypothetical protein